MCMSCQKTKISQNSVSNNGRQTYSQKKALASPTRIGVQRETTQYGSPKVRVSFKSRSR